MILSPRQDTESEQEVCMMLCSTSIKSLKAVHLLDASLPGQNKHISMEIYH
jgi:hypothetical protein